MYTILSVDDDKLIRKLISNTLRAAQYRVIDFESPLETINYLKNNKVDLLLLDFQMPEMNGIDCFRELKKISLAKDIPVLFVTSVSEGNKVMECIKEGAKGYLLKPIDTTILLEEIKKVLFNKEPVSSFDKRVLAIDDSRLGLSTIRDAISEICSLDLQTSANKALKYLKLNTVDLILLDYEMPEMNGLQTLKEIRKLDMNNNTPIFFITSTTNPNKIKECIKAGANDYILKPIDKEMLRKRVFSKVNTFV